MLWKKPSLQPIISSQFSKVTLKPPPTEPVKPEEFDISGHYKPEEEGPRGVFQDAAPLEGFPEMVFLEIGVV